MADAKENLTQLLPEGHRVLHRMVFPKTISPDIFILYAETESITAPSVQYDDQTIKRASKAAGFDPSQKASRYSITVPAQQQRSMGTYFNAFPASYWRRWTPVREVTLSIHAKGTGDLVVYKTNAKGSQQRIASEHISSEQKIQFELSLDTFGDGGWYWFDALAGDQELEILSAIYSASADLQRTEGTFSIGMTTMNKVSYCLENIATIAGEADLLEKLDTMYVIDQGTDRLLSHQTEIAPLIDKMGSQLKIIEQGNIGGSGGFSRGMYEATTDAKSTYVINCDDDILIEPESIIRLVTFADYATRPTLVGAHMFDLNRRSILHTLGEVVNRYTIQPDLAHPSTKRSLDLSAEPLRSTAWMHRRVDVDYNGWWMCLIPTEVVKEIGLSLPVFIKWDDAEYGLRAKNAGYPTVSLPGAGVWHVAWGDKDDLVGWQAFYHERNRLIVALLHSPYELGGNVLKSSYAQDIKHTISMQYYTQAGRLLAQQEVLAGPSHLHATIGESIKTIRGLAKDYNDALYKPNVEDFPNLKASKPPRKGKGYGAPKFYLLPIVGVKKLVKHTLLKPNPESKEHPEALIAHQDARWWALSNYDSALVSNAEGTSVAWHKRDESQARELMAQSAKNHAQLLAKWKNLKESFKAELNELTSFKAWEETFKANSDQGSKESK